jgi:hypothetical protein
MRVIVVDIGSVKSSRFGWAAFAEDDDMPIMGDNPQSCVDELTSSLEAGSLVALLLEAPTAVPVPSAATGWRGLGSARAGEGNRAWSAGAGSGALATGLAQGAWILGELASKRPATTVTTQIARWQERVAQLLLAEDSSPVMPSRYRRRRRRLTLLTRRPLVASSCGG